MLFSELIIWYLFLGGVGSGAYVIAFIINTISHAKIKKYYLVHENEKTNRSIQKTRSRLLLQYNAVTGSMQRAWLWSLVVTFVIICVSALCLFKDLAVPSKVLLLFIKPTFSVISVGSFILAALILILLFLLSIALVFKKAQGHVVEIIAKLLAAVLSVGMMVYTGIFLMKMGAVPLWSSAFLPVVFVLSSCSCGIAVMLLLVAFLQVQRPFFKTMLASLLKADVVIVVLEALAFFLLYWIVRGNMAAALSFDQLITGEYAQQFWIGFVFCAILVPVIISILYHFLKPSGKVKISMVSACSVLLGGFFMRYCLVIAGVHTSAIMFV